MAVKNCIMKDLFSTQNSRAFVAILSLSSDKYGAESNIKMQNRLDLLP